MSNDSVKAQVAALLTQFAGQHNVLVIPRPYLTLCGNDHAAALLLSQIVYWSDRTDDPEGWIAKSYADWEEELGLSRHQVTRALSKVLRALGVETEVRRSAYYQHAPTVHYRINRDLLVTRVLAMLNAQNDLSESSSSMCKNLTDRTAGNRHIDVPESGKTYTEITYRDYTETTTKHTDREMPCAHDDVEAPQTPTLQGQTKDAIECDAREESDESASSGGGRQRDVFLDTVCWVWGIRPGGYAGALKQYLRGKAKAGTAYAQFPIAPPVTAEELAGYRYWRMQCQLPLPKKPETIQRSIAEFRALRDYDAYLALGRFYTCDGAGLRAPWPLMEVEGYEDKDEDDEDGEGGPSAFMMQEGRLEEMQRMLEEVGARWRSM